MNRTVIGIVICAAVLLCGAVLCVCRCFARKKADDVGADKSLPLSERQTGAESGTARLNSFFWNQSHSNADKCFTFSFGKAQWGADADGHYLNCEFCTDDGEIVCHRDVPVTDEQWCEIETALHDLSLPPYLPPDPYISDAADSCIEIRRTENGKHIIDRRNGEYAHKLYSFLVKFIGRITE